MADFPISNVPRRVVFVADGVGPYSFTFEILEQTDIAVYKDDTLLTLTTDYTVSINADGTGSITLVAVPTGADQIALVGARAIQRVSDFTTGGDFFANTINDELDSLTIFSQQNAEAVARGLAAPQTDPTTIDMTLPRAADRAGKYLVFDVNGNPEPGDTVVEVAAVFAIKDEIEAVAAIDTEVVAVAGIAANVTTVAGISANVTTVAGISASVTAVAADETDIGVVATNLSGTDTIGTVAGVATEVAALGPISADITAVAAVDADVTTVAGISTEVGALSPISADITTVAGISADVTAVAADATDIGAVATNIANVNTVSTNIANVNTVAGISADVTSVAADATDIGTVATSIADVNTVAGISANVTTVAGISANVTTVAGISSDVTTVAGISTNVTTVAGLSADVTAVAADATDIGTVATSIANVNSVGTNIASVNTVAGGIANVNTVATNIADVGTVAGISANVSTVAGISSNVTTVAGVAGDLNAVALTVAPVEAMLPVAFDIPTLWWDTGDRLLSGASERLIISNWQVTSLFDTEEGGWYDTYDATELGGATVAGDVVPSLGDKSGNTNDATGENVLYATVPRPALYNNGVSSRMIVDLPYLGNNATIAYCSDQGVTILTGRNVGGSTDILHDRYLFGYVVIDRALTAQETLRLTQYLESRKYGYVAPAEYDGAVLLEDGFSLLMENDDRVDLEGVISYPLSV